MKLYETEFRLIAKQMIPTEKKKKEISAGNRIGQAKGQYILLLLSEPHNKSL